MVLNLHPLSVKGVVQVGTYPDAVGLRGRWLYVANAESNTMSILKGHRTPSTVGGVTYPYGVAVRPRRRRWQRCANASAAAGHGGDGRISGLRQFSRDTLLRARIGRRTRPLMPAERNGRGTPQWCW